MGCYLSDHRSSSAPAYIWAMRSVIAAMVFWNAEFSSCSLTTQSCLDSSILGPTCAKQMYWIYYSGKLLDCIVLFFLSAHPHECRHLTKTVSKLWRICKAGERHIFPYQGSRQVWHFRTIMLVQQSSQAKCWHGSINGRSVISKPWYKKKTEL